MVPGRSVGHRAVSVVLIVLIVVGAGLISLINAVAADHTVRDQLAQRAQNIAYALDGSQIQQLSGTTHDLDSSVYHNLKSKLTALKQSDGDTTFLYITGEEHSQLFIYVDSESPNSNNYNPPGQKYSESGIDTKSVFATRQVIVRGPSSNRLIGLAPIAGQNGETIAVLGVVEPQDIYTQALMNAIVRPAGVGLFLVVIVLIYEWIRRRDQQVMRMRSELVSIASHELRSPITGMRWAAESLLKSTAKTDQEPKAKAIYDSILHLQAGVEDILQMTRLTSNTQKLHLAPCDMTALMKEVCDVQRLPAEQKKVRLVMDDSWPATLNIVCDADRMKRALHNVVSNAIKYTRENSDVTIHYELASGMHTISVADHGIGIPEGERDKVFQGFYRASNAKASGAEGTGLGLFLTKTVLQQHHGGLTFTSKEGEGTTFFMTLPAKK